MPTLEVIVPRRLHPLGAPAGRSYLRTATAGPVAARFAAVAALCITLFCSALVAAAPAQAAPTGQLVLSVTVDGKPLAGGTVTLAPTDPIRLTMAVRNNGSQPVEIHSVRMSGAVLGMSFFVYDTAVGWMVPAGNEGSWTVDVPMDDLAGQATGLLPVRVELRGENRVTLAAAEGSADVRGSVVSAYGMFGLGLIVATVFLWTAVLFALARHRLPVNRWRRALRFTPAGAGVGLVLVVGLSALRVTPPTGSSEIGFVTGFTAGAFLLGYLTPTPRDPVPAATPPTPAHAPAPLSTPIPTAPYAPFSATQQQPPQPYQTQQHQPQQHQPQQKQPAYSPDVDPDTLPPFGIPR